MASQAEEMRDFFQLVTMPVMLAYEMMGEKYLTELEKLVSVADKDSQKIMRLAIQATREANG